MLHKPLQEPELLEIGDHNQPQRNQEHQLEKPDQHAEPAPRPLLPFQTPEGGKNLPCLFLVRIGQWLLHAQSYSVRN